MHSAGRSRQCVANGRLRHMLRLRGPSGLLRRPVPHVGCRFGAGHDGERPPAAGAGWRLGHRCQGVRRRQGRRRWGSRLGHPLTRNITSFMLLNKGGVTGVRPAGPRPVLPGLLPARERSELVQRSGAATIDGKRTADVPDTRGQRRLAITRSRGSCDSQATSAPTGSGRYSIRSRQPRTGRDSQGAASLQPFTDGGIHTKSIHA